MQELISEDDLATFEGWLKYQCIDAATTATDELQMWQGIFDEARKRRAATPKVGLMKLQPVPGEHRYAVAVRDGSDLWLKHCGFGARGRASISSWSRAVTETGTFTQAITSTAPCT